MSSDSDEPLSSLKQPHPCSSKPPEDSDHEEKKPRKRKKKKLKKIKLVLRPPSEGRHLRYYASQAEVERPQDVWLYIKDLNPTGPYSCLLCTEWFINKTKLVVHYVLNHKKDYCGICRYFVDNREVWKVHSEFHVPMNCSQCPEQFPVERELRAHFTAVHGSVHCRMCAFMMPEEQYNHHLFQRHNVTNVANKDVPVLWDTEYEGSPKFSCALCLKSGTPAVDFVKHYMHFHKFILKSFASLISGFDVPFSVYGANISSSFLENALKEHEKVGYVERDRSLAAQVMQEAETTEGNLNMLQVLIPDIKQEATSDAEEHVEVIEMSIDNDVPKLEKKSKILNVDDPILNYKGMEDFDVTLTELILMKKCYIDYLNVAIEAAQSNTLAIESSIMYHEQNYPDVEMACSLCPETYPSVRELGLHMVKMHCAKKVPTFFCRLCVATFDNEAEFKAHTAEELAEFDNLWLCQFCEFESEGRCSAREHLNEHYDELKMDNCFSPHLGFKCRYCPTLFWNEIDREVHHKRAHFAKHKEDFYKCNVCSDMFSDKIWFVHHIHHAHTDMEHLYMMKCAVCCLVLPTVPDVKQHFDVEHPEARKIFCSLGTCKFKPFSQSKSFKMHLQTFHGRDAKSQLGASCLVCGRQFPSARACSSHMALAHGPGRFKCKICGEVLQSSDERKLHFMLAHPGQHPFECVVCKRSFPNKSSLYMHRAKQHQPTTEGSSDFTCKYCGKKFLKKDSFREHVLIHEGPRHTCSYCPMRFVQRSNMLRHERRHTGERPYTCTYCGRAFSDKGACNSHMRVHMPHEVYPCPYCGQTFAQKSKLKYHIRRHTGEDLESCHMCSKLFTSVHSLREHLKTHDKGQRTTCPVCDRSFQSPQYMARHVRTAHGGRGGRKSQHLPCPLCDMTVANKVNLRFHVMTHSKIKHVKCRMCNKDYSCRKTMVKHLLRGHDIKGTADSLRNLYTELDPWQCQLGLDHDAMMAIFGPTKQRNTDVVISDYVTFPNYTPPEGQSGDVQREEVKAEAEEEEEGNSEEAAEELPVAEYSLKKRKKITYEYEEIAKKKKKRKKKKKAKRRRKSSEAEEEEEAEQEDCTVPTDFVSIKLEPAEVDDDQD